MSLGGSKKPKLPPEPPPPANTPSRADSSVAFAGESGRTLGTSALILTGARGLAQKANTKKKTLIGGAQ